MRVGGIISLQISGRVYNAKGDFDYHIGNPKRSGVAGADGVHGFTEKIQIPYVEGKITDTPDLDLNLFTTFTDATVTLSLANGKVIVLHEAYYAADGKGNTGEGELEFRAEGLRAEEVR